MLLPLGFLLLLTGIGGAVIEIQRRRHQQQQAQKLRAAIAKYDLG